MILYIDLLMETAWMNSGTTDLVNVGMYSVTIMKVQ